jgi:hypothetical protein
LKAPETKRQWPNRLKVVFDFLGLAGDLDEQAKEFMTLCKEGGTALVQDKIIRFISYQVQRAQKGEISLATIPNYLKAITLPLYRNCRNHISKEHNNILTCCKVPIS